MSEDPYDRWYRDSYPKHNLPDPSYWQRWRKWRQSASDLASVLMGVIGLAVVAVIVSNPNTPKLIEDAGESFGDALEAAVKPPEDGN